MPSMAKDELLKVYEILLPCWQEVSHARYFDHLFKESSIIGELSQPFVAGLIKFIEVMDANPNIS